MKIEIDLPDYEEKDVYFGIAKSVGIASPVLTPQTESHVTWGKTTNIKSTRFNIFGKN